MKQALGTGWRQIVVAVAVLACGAARSSAQSTWTPVTAPTTQNLWGVATGAGKFVAVGEGGTILSSTEGTTWNPRASGTTRWLTAVSYGGGRFVAVGDAGTVLASDDGETWTTRSLGNVFQPPRLNGVTYGNGTYLIVSENGSTFTSADTVAWRQLIHPQRAMRGLTFAYGQFVATGSRGFIGTDLTGSGFIERGADADVFLESVAYGRRTFVIVGSRGTVLASASAERWQPRTSGTAADLRGVSFFNGRFVAVGTGGAVLTSADAETWSARTLPGTPLLTAVAATETAAVAVGFNGALFRTVPDADAVAIVTPPRDVTEAAGSAVLFAVNATGAGPLTYQWNKDGAPLAGATADTLLVRAIRTADAGRYAVTVRGALGSPQTASATLAVLDAWPTPGPLVDPTFTATPAFTSTPAAIIEQPDGKLICGGNFLFLVNGTGQAGIVRLLADGTLDPTFATGTGATGGEGNVTALALQADGRVLLGGSFTTVAGAPRANLARLLANGALDPAFVPPTTLGETRIRQIAAQADGKVLVVLDGQRLLRLAGDGTPDVSFNTRVTDVLVERVATGPDRKLIVAGGQQLRRLLEDGAVDPTFAAAQLPASGVQFLRVLDDGRIMAGTQLGVTQIAWNVARFNADGSRDLSLPPVGGVTNRSTGSFAVDGRGQLHYQFSPSPFAPAFVPLFTRLTPNGEPDSTLRRAAGTAPDPQPSIILPLADGRTLIAGSFTSIDGTSRSQLARLVATNAPALNPPVFDSPPAQTLAVSAGATVSLTAAVAGSATGIVWSTPGSLQGTATEGGARYTITNIQTTGLYYATASNAAGTVTGPAFLVLVQPTIPRIVRVPEPQAVSTGRTIHLRVETRGTDPQTFQWFHSSTPIGGNSREITIPNATAAAAGTYTVVVRNALGSVTSTPVAVTVDETPRLANLATRGFTADGENVLTLGFVLAGPGVRRVIIRGAGPALAPFGVEGTVADPQLALFGAGGDRIDGNDDWGTGTILAAAFAQAGAFPFVGGSKDAAFLRDLIPGAYTLQLSAAGGSGVALAEIYEFDLQPTRIVNLSTRLFVGTGNAIAIPSIAVRGPGSRRFLVRAVGPGLAAFGVTGFLADPVLRLTTVTGTELATNDDWGTRPDAAAITAAAVQVAAFPLAAQSRDAALLVVLPAGNYTALVSGAAGGTGVALVEIYEVP